MKIPIDIKSGGIKESQTQQRLIVGIDLGTTNSLISYIKDGVPVAIKGSTTNKTVVPSVLYFDENDKPIVGEEALLMLESKPERTIYSVKRLMGKSFVDVKKADILPQYKVIENEDEDSLVRIQVGDKYYTPIDLSALILKELKVRAEYFLKEEVSAAVITVPAYFNDAQRQATRDAGKLAGLDVLRIVNEPTAASLGFGVGLNREDSKTVAVYDLGGGTFDISILNLEDGIFEVLSTNGNTILGGDDFDQAIIRYWQKTYTLNSHESKIRVAAEEAKKSLSTKEIYSTKIDNVEVSLTKGKFESLISDLVKNTIKSCSAALLDADLEAKDIDTLILVGGSTRVPLVKYEVQSFFGLTAIDGVDPDEVVALGAAVQADILAGNRKDLLLLDITPLSLGIETVGGLMDIIVPRNSKVPIRAAKSYTTSIDGQTNLKITVFQGERELIEHNRKLGEFILKGIPPMVAAMPKIEIAFILDADGILTVKAKELRSGTQTQIEIKSAYGISEEEMALMLIDSIKNAKSDMKQKNLQEAINEADNILLASIKFMDSNSNLFDNSEIEQMNTLLGALKLEAKTSDVDLIRKAIDELNTFSRPLAERVMDVNVSEALKGEKI